MLEGKDYLVIDDLVPQSLLESINNNLYIGAHWTFMPTTNQDEVVEKYKGIYDDSPQLSVPLFLAETQFTHPMFQEIRTIFHFLEDKHGVNFDQVFRVKANLTWPQPHKTLPNPPHIDIPDDRFFSMVFYVNESDGDTVLYDKKVYDGEENLKPIASISPKPGRALIFDSNRFHSSSPPENNKFRIIINSVFTPKVI